MVDIKVINPVDKAEYIIASNKTGENVILCPVCSHTRKKKTLKCFGYNAQKGAGRCNHCGVVLVEVKDSIQQIVKKVYEKPIWKNKTELSDNVVKWFESRKISQCILKEFNITESVEWMPQTSQNAKTINFNYFKFGELVNIKYRDRDKNFKLFKGAEMIFYNIDATIQSDEIIIVEGEMDVLAMASAGYKNVISVPNGCNEKGNINMDYLDNCIDLFSNDCRFILALDNDLVGNRLKDEFARRLGFENCTTVVFKDCKDANDCLMKYGIHGIIESIAEKKEFPIIGVFDANDIKEDIYNFYNNGLPPGCGIGMAEIDMHIKFQVGYMTIITGIPGHGKSEFLDFLLCRLNISHGWKTALYSPENHPLELHFSKMAEKMIGKPFEGSNRMNHLDLDAMIKYHADNFYFINPEDDFTIDSILSMAKALVRKKGIKALVIDAWNKLDHKQGSDTETSYISKALDKLALFCERNQIHLFLVAHPTKIQKDKKTNLYEIPNLYSISGSANFYNKTANGLTVYINRDTGGVEIHVQKVKFKHWGKPGCIHLGWDHKNGRYYKGTPNYDNWLYYDQPKQVEQNNDFLTQSNDLVINNDNEPPPF